MIKVNQYQSRTGGRGTIAAIALLVLLHLATDSMARICYSTGNGNWNQAATWTCTGTPLPGDTVIILNGHTVFQTNNQTYSGAPIIIQVYGTWQFSGGGSKITLPCGSYVEILEGGSVHPDPNYQGFSETVRICNVTYWNTTMGSVNGYEIWPPPPTPMPVELIRFDALNEDVKIKLLWSTASERDVSHFLIQRSTDLNEPTVVGSHPAAGNSMTIHDYIMFDAPRASGQYYYHLNEVGLDGTSHKIAVATSRFEKREQMLRCIPNPLSTSDVLTVDIPAHESGLDVHLVGTEGRWISPSSLDLDGTLMVVMDGLQLSSGIYTLRVMEGGNVLGTCRFRLE